MTTIEEIENEIAALKEALEIIENRTGDKFDNTVLKRQIESDLFELQIRYEELFNEQEVKPYEPEFDRYSKWDR